MAACMAQMCRSWIIRNIGVTVRLKQVRRSSVLSASLASYAGVFSMEKEYYGARFLSSFCLVPCCETSRKSRFRNRLLQGTHQIQSYKNNEIITSYYITTSALYLNEKDSISTGKRKLKERIEKVKEMRESILTIPNLLSAFRIVAAPFLGYFIISEEYTIAAGLFVVAGITDMLDGYIARNFKNQKSIFGTILDPVADKILMSVLTISLTAAELLPMNELLHQRRGTALPKDGFKEKKQVEFVKQTEYLRNYQTSTGIPLTVLILSRDVLLIAAAFYFRYKSLPSPKTVSRYFDFNLATVELRPNLLGKTNTVLQLGLVGSTLLAPIMGYVDHPYLQTLWYVVGTSTVLSSFSYLFSTSTSVRYVK